MRIALVHDWLTGMRGGEKVLRLLCGLLPQADLLTLIHVPGSTSPDIESLPIRTSFLSDLPGVGGYYRKLLPLMPFAAESLPADEYDLLISCSHCAAKGVKKHPDALHVSYCFTPMRYVWAQADQYRRKAGLSGAALRALNGYLRAWDLRSARHVDLYLANSCNVADRIGRAYGRDAKVVYSPIDADFYTPSNQSREDFFLMVTALSPYKRVDLAMEAFRQLGRPLRIIGSGPLLKRFRREAPSNVEVMGWQSDEVVRDHYRRCKALIFPGEEDFGLVPLEAMACGSPVIALGRGGALETVIDVNSQDREPTGLLFEHPSADSLVNAVNQFENVEDRIQPAECQRWASNFSQERFVSEFKQHVGSFLQAEGRAIPW